MVDFNFIPAAGSIREGLFFLEMDPSKAGTPVTGRSPVLFMGQMMATGTATAGALVRVNSEGHALGLFGVGSQLHEAIVAYRNVDATAEIWALPYADLGGGTAQTYTLTFGGAATADGTIDLYVGGRHIQTAVTSGDAAAAISTAVDAAVTADTHCCMTSGVAPPVVTLTAKHAAEFSKYIDVRLNYYGEQGLESLPAGVTCVVAAGAAGAGDPDISGAAAVLGTERYDFIVHPWTTYGATDPLTYLQAMHSHGTGRWSYLNMAYGHAYSAARDTVGNLTTLGNARNDPHHTIIGMDDQPNNPWQVTAAAVAACYSRLSTSPARPQRGLTLSGILPGARASRFTHLQRDGLLFDGISTLYTTDAGEVKVGRLISNYQTDDYGAADDAYLDVSTLYCLMRFNRAMADMAASDLVGKRLVDDGTYIEPGSETITPDIVSGMVISTYAMLEREGVVENTDLFAANLQMVRPVGDPNRLDGILPPDVANKLEVLALKNQFRLQYLDAA